MPRAFIMVLDSFGIGAAPDAAAFGDVGANTLGSIARWCADGNTAPDRPQAGHLMLPVMARLGLGKAAQAAAGVYPVGLENPDAIMGRYAACAEQSNGKDTPSGHWEMAGVPVRFDWGYFKPDFPSFPDELIKTLCERAGLDGILGNKAASGTAIIAELGEAHIASGKPICYTSADSVFQIAAHEESFGLERLYTLCEIARGLVDAYNIGRVIARPFVTTDDGFKRTGNRRDYATPPPKETLLDKLAAAGHEVISVGKIADIFAHQGLTQKFKATGNMALFDVTEQLIEEAPDGALIFTNFVDFDQEYGHRRNPAGYAAALEAFDGRLEAALPKLRPDDLVILTADHGCDPSWPGSDHTREYVPFIAYAKSLAAGDAGLRDSFADIGQTVADHLGLASLEEGISILR